MLHKDQANGALQDVFGQAADGVFAVDQRSQIVYWNASAETLLGFKASEALGRRCYEVLQGVDPLGRPFCRPQCPMGWASRNGKSVRSFDLLVGRKDGERCLMNVGVIPLGGAWRRMAAAVYVLRPLRPEQLLLREAWGGGGASASPSGEVAALTHREREVLRGLAEGLDTQALSQRLGIRPSTVRNHLKRVFAKLGVHSRVEAVCRAHRDHLL